MMRGGVLRVVWPVQALGAAAAAQATRSPSAPSSRSAAR